MDISRDKQIRLHARNPEHDSETPEKKNWISFYKQQQKLEKKKWEEKQLYGYFKRQTGEIAHEKTWV